MQCFSRQGLSVSIKTAGKLSGQMLCIRSTAAIATEVNPVSFFKRIRNDSNNLFNGYQQFFIL